MRRTPKGWRVAGGAIGRSSQLAFDTEALIADVMDPNGAVLVGSFLNQTLVTRQPWDSTDSPVHIGDLVIRSLAGNESGSFSLSFFNDGNDRITDPDETRFTWVQPGSPPPPRQTQLHVAPRGEFLSFTVGPEVPEPIPIASLTVGLALLAMIRRRGISRGRRSPGSGRRR